MKKFFSFKCPYCGFKNTRYLKVPKNRSSEMYDVVYCDLESGGCDHLILVEKWMTISCIGHAISSEQERYNDVNN